MKKAFALLLCLSLLATAAPAAALPTAAEKSGSYEYEVVDEAAKECAITRYRGSGGNVTIPSTLGGYKVTEVGCRCSGDACYDSNGCYYGAFSDCTSLTSVTIPDGVTTVGNGAFYKCAALTSVTMPDSVTSIGRCAFRGCKSLAGVTIPDNVTEIGWTAFWGCKSLTSVTIPDSVTKIGSWAFEECLSLASVTIGDGVTNIGNGAFWGVASLTSVTIGNGVSEIGDNAFFGCKNLRYNTYDNAKYLGNETNPYVVLMKAKNQDIAACEIHPDTKAIYDSAFCGCTSLASVAIPDGAAEIGWSSFSGCTSLTSVTIGNGATKIDWEAFRDCASLASVAIPDSVTSIGWYAFSGCASLTDVRYAGTKAQWKAIQISDYNEPLLNAGIHCSRAAPAAERGDVTGDGVVDNIDAAIILKFDAGLIDEADMADFGAGDVDGDGETDNTDAAKILQYDAALISLTAPAALAECTEECTMQNEKCTIAEKNLTS